MKKHPEITQATKNRITEAFFRVYEDKPINKIRIIDITEAANCNRSTFYEYFKDIYDVLEYLEERIIQDIIVTAKKYAAQNAGDHLPQMAAIYDRNGKYICRLLGDDGDPKFMTLFKDALYSAFLDKEHIADSMEAKIIYEYSLTGFIMAFCWWYLHQDQCPLESFIKIMHSLIAKGTLNTLGSLAS